MSTRSLVRLALALFVALAAAAPAFAQSKPAASQTATEFYTAYSAVFDKATKMEDILPYMSAKLRAQADATPKEERAKMFELVKMMRATNIKVVKETRAADGSVTLALEGLDSDKSKGTGTIDIVKENGEWKVGKESWKFGSGSK